MEQKIHVNMNMETIGKMDGNSNQEEMNSLVAYIKEVSVTVYLSFVFLRRRFFSSCFVLNFLRF